MVQEPAPAKFVIGDAIRFGWERFKQNIGTLAGIAILVWVVEFFFNLFLKPEGAPQRIGIQLIGVIISTLIGIVWITASLEINSGHRFDMADIGKHFNKMLAYLGASILFWLMAVAGLILFIIPGVIVMLTFGFYGYCMVDKDLGVMDSLKRSAEITRGSRGQLFMFGLALFGLNILGLLCLIVGVLVTSGISLIALGYVYRKLDAASVTSPAG